MVIEFVENCQVSHEAIGFAFVVKGPKGAVGGWAGLMIARGYNKKHETMLFFNGFLIVLGGAILYT